MLAVGLALGEQNSCAMVGGLSKVNMLFRMEIVRFAVFIQFPRTQKAGGVFETVTIIGPSPRAFFGHSIESATADRRDR